MKIEDIRAFMIRNRYGVVSTIADNGSPQSALVGIAITPELQIIFDTVSTSRKYGNLIARPACSFVIGWSGEQTVQFEGEAFEPLPGELQHWQEVYFSTWPDGRLRAATWKDIAYFVVKPTWVRYSDYDQTPRLIEELHFRPAHTRA